MFIVISIGYIGIKLFSILKDVNKQQIKEGYFVPEKSGEYKFLFSKAKYDSIEPDFAHVSSVSFPTSTFDYTNKNDSYKIIIYKFRAKDNDAILENVKINRGNTTINGEIYNDVELNQDIDADSRFESLSHNVNNITISINGSSIRNVITTDSLLGYDFNMKNVGVTFNQNSIPNICLFNDHLFKRISTQILFCRQKDFLYLLVLASLNSKDINNPKLLLSLVKNK